MLFAVSGSQGSGKSTTLAMLESFGYNVLKRKISRSILDDWNVTLNEVNTDMELTLKFQDEILKRKAEDELIAANSDDIYFTERVFTDSFVYYLFSFGKVSDMGSKINDYYSRCVEYNKYYDGVFQLPTGKFKTEDDGVRNANPLYGASVDVVLNHFLEIEFNRELEFDGETFKTPRLYNVTPIDATERANFVRGITEKIVFEKRYNNA